MQSLVINWKSSFGHIPNASIFVLIAGRPVPSIGRKFSELPFQSRSKIAASEPRLGSGAIYSVDQFRRVPNTGNVSSSRRRECDWHGVFAAGTISSSRSMKKTRACR